MPTKPGQYKLPYNVVDPSGNTKNMKKTSKKGAYKKVR